jgi:hypothetical protein
MEPLSYVCIVTGEQSALLGSNADGTVTAPVDGRARKQSRCNQGQGINPPDDMHVTKLRVLF